MKTVKILSLTLLMSIFCAGTSFAQQRGHRGQQAKPTSEVRATPEERAAKRVEMMKESLNLTPDQVAKLQPVQTQFAKDQARIRNAAKENQKEMKANREAYDAQLKSILTPEQYQKLQEQRKDIKKGRGEQQGKSKGNRGGKPQAQQGAKKACSK